MVRRDTARSVLIGCGIFQGSLQISTAKYQAFKNRSLGPSKYLPISIQNANDLFWHAFHPLFFLIKRTGLAQGWRRVGTGLAQW